MTFAPTASSQTSSHPALNAMAGIRAPAPVSPIMAQQRQILGLMGLDIWVQRDRATLSVDYEALSHALDEQPLLGTTQQQAADQQQGSEASKNSAQQQSDAQSYSRSQPQSLQPKDSLDTADQSDATATAPVSDNDASVERTSPKHSLIKGRSIKDPIQALKEKLDVHQAPPTVAKAALTDALQQVAPFEIMGAYYRDWVLLVDTAAFENESVRQLWQSLLIALSLTPQGLKFPICTGISDKESANASVAGFVFCLAKNNHAKVGCLTRMPDAITHPCSVDVPSLSQMLADSDKKRQLWQLLNQRDDAS
ncbi:hypothetical protein [Psychrobacter sanguinis]|uniref:DNA polymerase III subunit psi n=1 Tax=Psychrobacter sanguinis TaxID=861445 RepID=A0A844M2R4_9GAMM|nr:hypothetical protein [Psychrobacter sanguinis]MUG32807.1 hypothetical protein [Psychrobacter sanguinis]